MNIEVAIALIKKKDEKGLSFLYENYSRALKGIIVRIVNSEEMGEEILQQTFLKIWTKIDSFDPEKATIFTWMARIAKNAAIDQRRLKKFEHQRNTYELDERINGGSMSTDHSSMDVSKLLSDLDEKYKAIIDCVYLQGFTQQEASERLNIPLGTVKTRMRKAICLLREQLKDEKVLFIKGLMVLILMLMMLWS